MNVDITMYLPLL